MVRMLITDPMHTFYLGMVQNEVKLCLKSLLDDKLAEFNRRLKGIRMPYDLGRLPTGIKSTDGLAGLTAQQWKNFACVYAKPCFVGLLSDKSFKSLCLLCEIVVCISKPTLNEEDIVNLYRMVQDHHKAFTAAYGKWSASINYHMALHICDVITDYGPPHGYWCYAYERMNGYFSDIPNNRKNIESQLMATMLKQLCSIDCELPDVMAETPDALKAVVSADVEIDTFSAYPYRSLYNSEDIDYFELHCKIDRGEADDWPVEFHHPSKSHVKVDDQLHRQLVEYCNKVYDEDFNVYINPRIDKFGRCTVNGQNYSSDFNSTDRGSVVKAYFVLKDTNELQPYFGIVKFFFKLYITFTLHTTTDGTKTEVHENLLAYVTWMCFKTPAIEKKTGLHMVNNAFYEQDRVISPRRFVNRCALAPAGKSSSSYYVIELPR